MDGLIQKDVFFIIFQVISFLLLLIILRDVVLIREISNNVNELKQSVHKLTTNIQLSDMENHFSSMLDEATKNGDPMLFRTADGKHVAKSPNELLAKMMDDPEYGYNPADIEKLKDFFGRLKKKYEEQSPDDIDDDDGDEEWK